MRVRDASLCECGGGGERREQPKQWHKDKDEVSKTYRRNIVKFVSRSDFPDFRIFRVALALTNYFCTSQRH